MKLKDSKSDVNQIKNGSESNPPHKLLSPTLVKSFRFGAMMSTYESVEQRVIVNCKKERFSISFFFNPAHYTIVEPLKELIHEQNPSKYRPYNFGKYLVKRKESNSQKQNVENLLISHFRLL
ncbi:probable 2-oxoglutarate-dependent dioxygenase At5g05600 [Neltuma alba]|uniref:probable 2-oxoglutarate-dependent dioxygenase At5g05600 n=1 Tax=Neltuma alba TaxID=207710 RepID=UPI0010A393B2|nr:probable 2-oxoglutarate-dependent dioxygenase At5g05600 [Prosopis alba]